MPPSDSGFQYACFISYCHGQGELMRRFIDDLKAALYSSIEPYMDQGVYIDEDRLRPGYDFNEALAEALCKSVCMVVVYSPRYDRHPYCHREFRAMEQLERQRYALLGAPQQKHRLIIPIVVRGARFAPPVIKSIQYCDFSKYTTAGPSITSHPEYIAEIDRIAGYVYERYQEFEPLAGDLCTGCIDFALPAEDDLPPWRDHLDRPAQPPSPFPGRRTVQP